MINGIIEFDTKLTLFSTYFLVQQHSLSKKRWIIICSSLLAYLIGFEVYSYLLWTPKNLDFFNLMKYFFNSPCFIDFIIIISSYYFLNNLEVRFRTLNDLWKRQPTRLVTDSGQWTYSEIAMSMESIRLLHAELSELLNVFRCSFGSIHLGFFVLNYIFMLINFLFIIVFKLSLPEVSSTENIMRNIRPFILSGQYVILTMSIIVAASSVSEKVGNL